jgi:hypothetical protein
MLANPATTGYSTAGLGAAGAVGAGVMSAKALKAIAKKVLKKRVAQEIAATTEQITTDAYLKRIGEHTKKLVGGGVQLAKDNPMATAGIVGATAAIPLTAYALNKQSSLEQSAQLFANKIYNDNFFELLPGTIAEWEAKQG